MGVVRVLQVATIMNRGGLETMLMNYYRKVDKTKIQFDFMVHRMERGDYDDEIEAMGGRIYRMPQIKPGNYRKYFKELERFFEEHSEYKVVHSHINENSGFVLRAAKKYGVPCRIAHNHVSGLGIDYKFPFRMYARMVLKNMPTDLYACSEEAGKWLFGKNKVINNEINILNNAIDLENFKYKQAIRNKLRNELNIDNKLVIGHVGRFHKSKNHEFLVDVFNEVYKKNKDTVLLLIGNGSELNSIKDKVNKLNINENVIFLGVRSDISQLMNAMDVFVFPSKFEALPVVLVEAQATGLKCIVSTGVPPEVDITNSIEFLELTQRPNVWANKILNLDIKHNDNSILIKEKGYDIWDNVNKLTQMYIEKSK